MHDPKRFALPTEKNINKTSEVGAIWKKNTFREHMENPFSNKHKQN